MSCTALYDGQRATCSRAATTARRNQLLLLKARPNHAHSMVTTTTSCLSPLSHFQASLVHVFLVRFLKVGTCMAQMDRRSARKPARLSSSSMLWHSCAAKQSGSGRGSLEGRPCQNGHPPVFSLLRRKAPVQAKGTVPMVQIGAGALGCKHERSCVYTVRIRSRPCWPWP